MRLGKVLGLLNRREESPVGPLVLTAEREDYVAVTLRRDGSNGPKCERKRKPLRPLA
jgi:hypothetical protein